MVAIYTLVILSRDANAMDAASSSLRLAQPLAFLWAPFLLIHLGGQDTITAFDIEDNKLWLRHLLNLLVQVTLAMYVFWKSSSWHSTQVLVPGILLFVAGIIKYGERITALGHGNLNYLNSMGQQDLPDDDPPILNTTTIIRDALRSAPGIRMLFARRKTCDPLMKISRPSCEDPSSLFKFMGVELGMVYSDLYTKAAVLRTRIGIVFRCISLSCTAAALVLFFFFTNTYTTAGGSRVDTIITYTLFIGVLVVDVCMVLTMVMASPWTWAWLRARGHHRMASMSMCLASSCDMVSGWLGTTKSLWSNTMGQYRFVCYDDDSHPWCSPPPPPRPPPRPTCLERVMSIIRKLASGEDEKKPFYFWLSKLLETKHVVVDDNVTKCLVAVVDDILPQPSGSGGGEMHQQRQPEEQQWQCLGQLLLAATTHPECKQDFVRLICWLHACTEVLLREAAAAATEAPATTRISIADADAAAASADVCRKLSRYMVYLVAVHPDGASLLQVVRTNPDKEYKRWERYSSIRLQGKQHQVHMGLLRLELEAAAMASWGRGSSSSANSNSNTGTIMASSLPRPEHWQRTLKELERMWARLLVYAAAKSRPEAHAAALARGGELLTFVWLLLCHNGLGDAFQIDLVPSKKQHVVPSSSSAAEFAAGGSKTYYVFKNLPTVQILVNSCCPQLLVPPAQTDSRSSGRS